jgi:threonyl-tRNA synthetase
MSTCIKEYRKTFEGITRTEKRQKAPSKVLKNARMDQENGKTQVLFKNYREQDIVMYRITETPKPYYIKYFHCISAMGI